MSVRSPMSIASCLSSPLTRPSSLHPMSSFGGRPPRPVIPEPSSGSTARSSQVLHDMPMDLSIQSKKRMTPPIHYTARGDKRRGLEVARSPELLDMAVEEYRREVRSVGDTSDDNVKTWQSFHDAVCWTRFGLSEPCPMLPLTPVKVAALGSTCKKAGYRSTKNYLSAVKKLHITANFSWAEQLTVARRLSVALGRGSSRARCRGAS